MTALSAGRNTAEREGRLKEAPAKGSKVFYEGGIAVMNGNYAEPATAATGLLPLGRIEERLDTTGLSDGAKNVKVKAGVFRYANSAAADEIAAAQIGQLCYLVDDQTVAKTDSSGTRSAAGYVIDVDSAGVWVAVGYGLLDVPGGALLAANNLSDVAAAATARANLGTNKIYLAIHADDLSGTDVYRGVSPVAGTITKIRTLIEGALATGDATLTGKIGAVAITDGVVTITQAGSAAGDVDTATPSAANTVADGSDINFTVGGTNTAAVRALILVEITF